MWTTGQPVLHFRPHNPPEYQSPHFISWAADITRTGFYGFAAQADGTLKIANHGPGRRVHPAEPRTIAPGDEARCRTFFRNTFPGRCAADRQPAVLVL